MKQIRHNTSLFKNIFPDYNVFKKWYNETGLSDDESDCPSAKTFTLIAYEYNDSHACMSDESFKEHFAVILYTYYREFEETSKSIVDLMNLTDKDIELDDMNVYNIANIPETESSTDEMTVDFISQQNKTIIKKNKLRIKKEQLSNKRAFTVKTFLRRFESLFIKILSPAYTYVVEEEDNY